MDRSVITKNTMRIQKYFPTFLLLQLTLILRLFFAVAPGAWCGDGAVI